MLAPDLDHGKAGTAWLESLRHKPPRLWRTTAMIRSLDAAAVVWILSAAVLATALPGVAATVPSNTAALKAAVADDAIPVQAPRNIRPGYRSEGRGSGQVWHVPDTIGSIGYDGRGYGYNRFSGQVYQSCMEDLGYGRVRPCDAGGR